VVNTARRMLDEAAAGGIVVSDTIFAQLPGQSSAAAQAVDLGEIKLRGRDAPMHLWRIFP
jgi:class 3 adenylate cyclase